MKVLRPYQEKAHAIVKEELQAGIHNQLLVMATGTGKTLTTAHIMQDFNHTLWVTHTEELINQSAGVMRDFGFATGIVKAERMETSQRCVVASIQTLWRRLDRIHPDTFDMVVFDEAHMAMAKTWHRTFDHFNAKLKLGLTATPWRADGMPLGDIFDKIVYQYNIQDGISDGYLCELEAYRVRTQISLDKVRTTAGELNSKDLRIIDCTERNNLIVDKYLEYAEGRPALSFCVDVEHAMNLSDTFNRRGLTSTFVIGDKKLCPDREHRISLFKDDEIRVMTNCMVLTHGFDYPNLACIIMACPTKSLTKYFQCIGRGTRLKEIFKSCIILDVVDVTRRHHLVNTWTLDKEKKTEDKLFLTADQKKEKIEREKSEIKADKLSKKDEKADLFAIPEVKKYYYTPSFKEPATPAQLELMAKHGYDSKVNSYTKGMISKILDDMPASSKQIGFLKWKGYDVNDDLTRAQAQACFDNYAERKGEVPEWKKKQDSAGEKPVAVEKTFKSFRSPFNDL